VDGKIHVEYILHPKPVKSPHGLGFHGKKFSLSMVGRKPVGTMRVSNSKETRTRAYFQLSELEIWSSILYDCSWNFSRDCKNLVVGKFVILVMSLRYLETKWLAKWSVIYVWMCLCENWNYYWLVFIVLSPVM